MDTSRFCPARLATAALLGGLLLAAGCAREGGDSPGANGAQRAANDHLVEVYRAMRAPVSTSHDRTGTLLHRRLVRIHNREEGRIEELPHFEGDAVVTGDPLVRIDDSLLNAELAKAHAQTREARLDLDRVEGLTRKKAASEDERVAAETALQVAQAEQQLLDTRIAHTRINAPFDGIVSERLVEPGDVAARNSHLLTLVDPRSLIAEFYVSELTLPQLRVDDPVVLRIDALGSGTLQGRIQRIHPELDAYTRQGKVEVELTPIPADARAGQFARGLFTTAARPRLLLPFAAVQRDRDGEFVYRLDAQDQADVVRITSGTRIADKIEIISGIQDGDRIVVRGFLGLRPGSAVKPVSAESGTSD
ncbi:MAG: efflux RND transporter periplasmic adaptor subunit [Pseudomonadota bacterium]